MKDDGMGIAPESKDCISGIFRRLAVRGGYTGTSIGLAVCKKL